MTLLFWICMGIIAVCAVAGIALGCFSETDDAELYADAVRDARRAELERMQFGRVEKRTIHAFTAEDTVRIAIPFESGRKS